MGVRFLSMIKKFCSFICRIFSYFRKKSAESEETAATHFEDNSEEQEVAEEEKLNVAKRTLITELYLLEQEISVFEHTFPNEYKEFMERIELLREKYIFSLEELKKVLTFEIDPELDSVKIGEVIKLEQDIKKFLEKEVKFDILSKRLQKLIKGLNILYNSSISYSKEFENEKEKISSRVEQALEVSREIACELKANDYILNDNQLKERLINLISYADYELFKISMRNLEKTPDNLIQNLVVVTEFKNFDYVSTFVAFIKDELTDLGCLLVLITDEAYCRVLRKKLQQLLMEISSCANTEDKVLDCNFWYDFLALESNLLEMLKLNGNAEEAKINLLVGMNIQVDEKDVLLFPKTNAYLSLTSIYAETHDKRILLLIKALKEISDKITYKEIYFLIVLFDALEIVQSTSNNLIRYIKKYIENYGYDTESIMKKKEALIKSSQKEYVVIFTINDYDEDVVTTLKTLNIDFKVEEDKVFINSFYFNGLQNVSDSLEANTQNTTT